MITLDCQPYRVVDDGGFKALVHALELKYHIQSQRYVCEIVIPSIVCTVQERIKKQYVSLTTNIWSSDVNSDSLLSVTTHWVDNWQPLSTVLQAHSLEERHTGEYIAMKILRMSRR